MSSFHYPEEMKSNSAALVVVVVYYMYYIAGRGYVEFTILQELLTPSPFAITSHFYDI
jgi:hypothetical protein